MGMSVNVFWNPSESCLELSESVWELSGAAEELSGATLELSKGVWAV